MRRIGWRMVVVGVVSGLVVPLGGPAAGPSSAADDDYIVRKIVVGQSAKGRDIVAVYKGTRGATQTVLVLGQMHGDEKAGPLIVDRMIKRIHVGAGKGAWFITTMNPDGNAKNTRTNARVVDLNRNWSTSGWTGQGKGSLTWGGTSKQSEPETRAMVRFLRRYKPDYVASLHQPFGVVAKTGIDKAWEKRLSDALKLPVKPVGVGTPSGKTSPTLTGWYNRYHGASGTATTIELRSKVSEAFRQKASHAILRAAKVV